MQAILSPSFEITYRPDIDDNEAIETIKSCLLRNAIERAKILGVNGLLSKPFIAKRADQVTNFLFLSYLFFVLYNFCTTCSP